MNKSDIIIRINIFPPVREHTHGATVVELSNGDLLAAWFQGSGERWADDVRIMGARLHDGDSVWSQPFLMADVPDFPDINPVLFIDHDQKLWLVWYTVIANQWETSLPTFRISNNYMQQTGPPVWEWQQTLLVKPGDKTEHGILPTDRFVAAVENQVSAYRDNIIRSLGKETPLLKQWEWWKGDLMKKARGENMIRKGYYLNQKGERVDSMMGYPYFRRMGWQTKNKPFIFKNGRIVLPLYSDGFSFSLMAITDDSGRHWQFSTPIVGPGNIQPAIAIKKDGTLTAFMRDNGPPPQRLMYSESSDSGRTWSLVSDTQIPNPGSGADIVTLSNGHWVLAYNNTRKGRNSLAVSVSEDEGKSWIYTRHIERDNRPDNRATSFAYPAIIEGKGGIIHIVYSYHPKKREEESGESIRYARITEEWIRQGDDQQGP